MTSLQKNIEEATKSALKNGDQFVVDTLRMLTAVFQNKSIEKRGKGLGEELTEDEVLEVLNREVKKRREAAEIYKKGARLDLAENEEKELAIIQKYLPAELPREEVVKIIDKIIDNLRQGGAELSLGNAMKEVMKELKGKADSKIISEVVKEKVS